MKKKPKKSLSSQEIVMDCFYTQTDPTIYSVKMELYKRYLSTSKTSEKAKV